MISNFEDLHIFIDKIGHIIAKTLGRFTGKISFNFKEGRYINHDIGKSHWPKNAKKDLIQLSKNKLNDES